MTGEPQAVIFDFDGVLVDSEPAHYRAFQAVLGPLGLGYDWDTYLAHYMGFDDRDGFREALRAAGRPVPEGEDLEALIRAKTEAFEAEMRAGLTPIPGAAACVHRLAGYPRAVCSGALRSEIEPTLAALGIEEAMLTVVAADDVARSKPDPESYDLARRRLGEAVGRDLDPAACVAIEDTPTGVASARSAGLCVVGLALDGGAGPDGAHTTVSAMEEVTPELLGRLLAVA
jgi:HAD superfamily hydrolase (TIGR01509 family)